MTDSVTLRSFNERMYNLLLAIQKESGLSLKVAELYFDVIEDYESYRGKRNEGSTFSAGS